MEPTKTSQQPFPTKDRKPGRSFENPELPLGQELLEQSGPSDPRANEDFRSREAQADMPHNGVAERAKAVSVMRLAEELIATHNPGANDDASLERCFDLAGGRLGLKPEEYASLIKDDPELIHLDSQVRDAARAHFPHAPKPKLPTL